MSPVTNWATTATSLRQAGAFLRRDGIRVTVKKFVAAHLGGTVHAEQRIPSLDKHSSAECKKPVSTKCLPVAPIL